MGRDQKNTLYIRALRLSTENFWVAIFWIMIFMMILAWDQEKIVLLNLILFLYIIYFGASSNFETIFEVRQKAVLDSLTIDLSHKVATIRNNLTHASDLLCSTNSVVLILISSNISISNFTILEDLTRVSYAPEDVSTTFATISAYFAMLASRFNTLETGKSVIMTASVTRTGA